MRDYDLVVVGGGPGGYVAAAEAGKRGKSVLLVEEGRLGGVCLNAGCIPTKTLLHTSRLYSQILKGEVKGIAAARPELAWEEALEWKDEVVSTFRKSVESILKTAKVDVLQARARLAGRSAVEAGGEVFSARAIVIAAGSRPSIPPIPGLGDSMAAVTSAELLDRKTLPERLAVIGAGVVGLELGAMYSQLGSKVDIVEMLPDILPFMEPEQAKGLMRSLHPIDFHLDTRVLSVEREGETESALVVAPNRDGNEAGPVRRIAADTILVATGRRANIEDLGLEGAGVKTSRGFILVNERMETSAPRVYAVGDVVGTSLFAHSASRMAEVAVKVLCGDRSAAMRYDAIPWALYTWPEAAGCGLTEAAAIAAGRRVSAVQLPMRASARFFAEQGKQPGMIKVVADAEQGRILGVHMLGAGCSEMIWGASMAVRLGLTVDEAAETIFPHPTAVEVLRDVLVKLIAGRGN